MAIDGYDVDANGNLEFLQNGVAISNISGDGSGTTTLGRNSDGQFEIQVRGTIAVRIGET